MDRKINRAYHGHSFNFSSTNSLAMAIMSQRDSGYQRIERDNYETPAWVTEALLPHLPDLQCIWEPASGSGKMARVLNRHAQIVMTDISTGHDFLKMFPPTDIDAIITNPPYEFAQSFINHALEFTKPGAGLVAMLLRTDFDHAKTRRYMFGNCPQFAKKLVLTKRIQWFEDSKGQPSFNHAWFIWDWKHSGPPTLAYGP